MATNIALFLKDQSITRSPIFNSVNYVSWKRRMKIFLQFIDIELWYIVNECPYEATILDIDLGRFKSKIRSELTVENKTNLTLNAKAMNVCIMF